MLLTIRLKLLYFFADNEENIEGTMSGLKCHKLVYFAFCNYVHCLAICNARFIVEIRRTKTRQTTHLQSR